MKMCSARLEKARLRAKLLARKIAQNISAARGFCWRQAKQAASPTKEATTTYGSTTVSSEEIAQNEANERLLQATGGDRDARLAQEAEPESEPESVPVPEPQPDATLPLIFCAKTRDGHFYWDNNVPQQQQQQRSAADMDLRRIPTTQQQRPEAAVVATLHRGLIHSATVR